LLQNQVCKTYAVWFIFQDVMQNTCSLVFLTDQYAVWFRVIYATTFLFYTSKMHVCCYGDLKFVGIFYLYHDNYIKWIFTH
jgi:hypothetical protein